MDIHSKAFISDSEDNCNEATSSKVYCYMIHYLYM